MPKEKKETNFLQKISEKKLALAKKIKIAVKGLYYISETDAEVLPFAGGKAVAVTIEEILKQTKKAAETPTEERDFGEFFARLTEIQDWYGEEEKETAAKFAELKKLLEKNLRDLKVFKIGSIQLEIYAVGLDEENDLMGIKTEAVET